MDGQQIKNTKEILIISGEGDFGDCEIYTGKRSERVLKSRLTRERCNGDRWASALLYAHETDTGHVGIDFENGEVEKYPWKAGSRG